MTVAQSKEFVKQRYPNAYAFDTFGQSRTGPTLVGISIFRYSLHKTEGQAWKAAVEVILSMNQASKLTEQYREE